MNLASIPILTRLLSPSEFGLVVMTTVVTGFANTFVDAGFTAATIQNERVTRPQVNNLFWLSTGLGILMACIVAAMSPLIAWFYNEPRLVGITLAMSLSFVFTGASLQHLALLRRGMQFKRMAGVQIFSSATGQATAVIWALISPTYWALVAMPVSMAIARALGAWLTCSWRPGWPRRNSGVRSMATFGGRVALSHMCNYIGVFSDRLLIGKFFGAYDAGIYDKSWQLLLLPIRQVNGPISSVIVPTLSRLQNKPEQYERAALRTVGLITVLLTPVAAVSIVAPEWVIPLVFGDQWFDAVPVFQLLSVGAIALPFLNSVAWMFLSQGRVKELLRWQITDSIFRITMISIGLWWGLLGVAFMYSMRAYLALGFSVWYLGRRGPIRASSIARLFLSAFLVFVLCCVVSWPIHRHFEGRVDPWLGLLMIVAACGITSLAGFYAIPSIRKNVLRFHDIYRSLVSS